LDWPGILRSRAASRAITRTNAAGSPNTSAIRAANRRTCRARR
jgi:hypothetical protein